MIEMHFNWVMHYGYPVIFFLLVLGIVGLPVPDETLLTFAGYLVSRHDLNPGPTLLAAFFGSACGITISYGLGRTLGLYLVHRFGRWLYLDENRLDQICTWYQQRGKYALLIGYYVPGIRHVTAYVAGSAGLPVRTFSLYAWTGALIWSASFITFGYMMGEGWRKAAENMHQGLVALFLLVGSTLLLLYFTWRHRKTRERKG